MTKPPYTLTISLNVLEHLGINLYSNIPAVISEAVANSWDADAKHVEIKIDTEHGTIEITDDGCGMNKADINGKYLMVGYKKREHGERATASGRPVMGRKGIGKLSLFSIANTIEVRSVKAGEKNGFIMSADGIKAAIEAFEKKGNPSESPAIYEPSPIQPAEIPISKGTKITLKDLKKELTRQDALRVRIANRFSVIGKKWNFEVKVNDNPITIEDRHNMRGIDFLWTLGDEGAEYTSTCTGVKERVQLEPVVDSAKGYRVWGWVGTVEKQKNLEDGDNTLPVLARGKLIHEDILKDLKEARVFAKYLVGEIHADFFDDDGKEDMATSDRQSVKEDDTRFEVLRKLDRKSTRL